MMLGKIIFEDGICALRDKSDIHILRRNNGDKLRSMSNEELARYLWIETSRMTAEEWLDWLNKES